MQPDSVRVVYMTQSIHCIYILPMWNIDLRIAFVNANIKALFIFFWNNTNSYYENILLNEQIARSTCLGFRFVVSGSRLIVSSRISNFAVRTTGKIGVARISEGLCNDLFEQVSADISFACACQYHNNALSVCLVSLCIAKSSPDSSSGRYSAKYAFFFCKISCGFKCIIV